MEHLFGVAVIGNQIWMADNLNEGEFSNGDPIFHATTMEEWVDMIESYEPASCYYGFDPEMGKTYGKLYNYFALSDERGLAPIGWRIPTLIDWMTLIGRAAGEDEAFAKDLIELSDDETYFFSKLSELDHNFCFKVLQAADALKSQDGWKTEEYPYYCTTPNGSNQSGFNAIAAGYVEHGFNARYGPRFMKQGQSACFWTADRTEDGEAKVIELKSSQFYDDGGYREDASHVDPLWTTKGIFFGLSVRCIKA
jgi:uncharacterized protein (TIGR02145 family)